MAETYCGKSCGSCTYKETMNCPGCKTGPGARIFGTCQLAKCCVSKGHNSCRSCNIKPRCGLYIGREQAPLQRAKALEAETKRQAEICARIKSMDTVFFLLFWLEIAFTIGSVLREDFLADPYPVMNTIGILIGSLYHLGYGIVLISQHRRERGYLIAGILSVLVAVLYSISEFNAPEEGTFNFATAISLIAGAVRLVVIYKEFTAHSEVLTGVDEIADKWLTLWRWMIGAYCAVLCSVILAIIAPVLGVLLALAGAVGVLVVDIVKIVYLHRSAKVCQEY